MKKIVVAIDGFSSCGKSTMAKALAKYASYAYIDTGAMYRAVALYAIDNNLIDAENIDGIGLNSALDNIKISFQNSFGVFVGILITHNCYTFKVIHICEKCVVNHLCS